MPAYKADQARIVAACSARAGGGGGSCPSSVPEAAPTTLVASHHDEVVEEPPRWKPPNMDEAIIDMKTAVRVVHWKRGADHAIKIMHDADKKIARRMRCLALVSHNNMKPAMQVRAVTRGDHPSLKAHSRPLGHWALAPVRHHSRLSRCSRPCASTPRAACSCDRILSWRTRPCCAASASPAPRAR